MASAEALRDAILIGVDAGATEVKAHAVEVVSLAPELLVRLGKASHRELCPPVAGFAPLEIDVQREQSEAPVLSPSERARGDAWIAATVRCIAEVARATGSRRAIVGVCAPGLKTRDGRGIKVALNAPRVPDFVDRLETGLAKAGIHIAAPIGSIASDGECCGLGERFAEGGLLRGLRHAYYVGGGTGLAEALLLYGRVVALDEVESWFPKAWRIRGAGGESYESLLAIAHVNRRFAERSRGRVDPTRAFPEEHVATDPIAAEVLEQTADALAELVVERMLALWTSPLGQVALERVVVGQRLGQLFADERTRALLADRSRAQIESRISAAAPADMLAACRAAISTVDSGAAAWEEKGTSMPMTQPFDLIRASALRAGPALGAAVRALREA